MTAPLHPFTPHTGVGVGGAEAHCAQMLEAASMTFFTSVGTHLVRMQVAASDWTADDLEHWHLMSAIGSVICVQPKSLAAVRMHPTPQSGMRVVAGQTSSAIAMPARATRETARNFMLVTMGSYSKTKLLDFLVWCQSDNSKYQTD